nr:amidohydrolase family protein [Leifsonia psychrotolerans]
MLPAGSAPPCEASIDGAGRVITSGLWDEHVHVGQWAQHSTRLDLGAETSADFVLERVAQALKDGVSELVGVRVRGGGFGGRPIAREQLDRVSGDIPVVLIGADLHGAWLNSAALRAHGFAVSGEGHVVEEDCFALVRELDRIDEQSLDALVAGAARAAAARGVVGIVDFEMRWNIGDWQRRTAAGFNLLRVEAAIYPHHLDRAIAAGFRTGDEIGESGLLRVGPLKVVTDGSLGTRTAWCCEPYSDGGHGRSLVSATELEALLRHAHYYGISAAVHAIGDRANTAALDAFERAGCGGRIEHAQLLRVEDMARFARLNVAASVQPEHLLDDRETVETVWPGRAERAFPMARLHAVAARLLFGSDAPVAPLDPWRAISAAVTRCRPGDTPWTPSECLPPEVALAASMRGRIRPAAGDPADLVLLDVDPLAVTGSGLADMPVVATLLAGRLTHAANGLR